MGTTQSSLDIHHQSGDVVHGFRVVDVTPTPEVRAVAYRLEHERTGARLIHLHSEDPENLFSISFPTPPADDTGLPHILEHAVLDGSQRYPVREPFFEMHKLSMATFINAMTYPDHTVYPISSNVKKDLFNLAEVYFDAVFHPLLSEPTFRREGHHLAPTEAAGGNGTAGTNGAAAASGVDARSGDQPDFKVTGVVYNEMKGAFSDPESRFYRAVSRVLLPDTVYAHESGGDPAVIPSLTYEQFSAFHATYYHPSNAYFMVYGDVALAEYCAFIDERLSGFDRRAVDASIDRQKRWDAPRTMEEPYPVAVDEPIDEKTYLSLVWLAGDVTDPVDTALLHILSLVLGGNEAAPLRKALVDSQLGQDVTGLGSSAIGREGTFSVGLKGSEADRGPQFVDLVLSTLRSIADDGIDPELVETAFSQAAFSYREVQPAFPRTMLFRIMSTWLYDADPLTYLRMGAHLQTGRERWQQRPEIFSALIRERLLDNPHRLLAVMRPDRSLQVGIDRAEAERARTATEGLDAAARVALIEQAKEVESLGATPNTPEQVAMLPQLTVQDLPPDLQRIATETSAAADGLTVLRNDILTNGVNYLSLDLSLVGLPEELWPYVPYYLDAMDKLGAGDDDYEAIARRKAAATGGVRASLSMTSHTQPDRGLLTSIRLSTKYLDGHADDAVAVVRQLLFEVTPRDFDRLHDTLVQGRASLRTAMAQDGLQTAMLHAGRGLTAEGHLAEVTRGLPQLALIESLTADDADRHEPLMARIEQIRDHVLTAPQMTASFTGATSVGDRTVEELAKWREAMPRGAGEGVERAAIEVGFSPHEAPRHEGLAAQMQVAYCAQVLPAPRYEDERSVAMSLAAHLMTFDYMFPEIRFTGNAYGTWFRYDPLGGDVSLSSYRDPHVFRTLDVFRRSLDFARQASWSQTDIDRAIIAVARREHAPVRPRPATGQVLQRHLVGVTDKERERRFAILKSLTPQVVKDTLVDVLEAGLPTDQVCVVSSREKLIAANDELDARRQLSIEDINRN